MTLLDDFRAQCEAETAADVPDVAALLAIPHNRVRRIPRSAWTAVGVAVTVAAVLIPLLLLGAFGGRRVAAPPPSALLPAPTAPDDTDQFRSATSWHVVDHSVGPGTRAFGGQSWTRRTGESPVLLEDGSTGIDEDLAFAPGLPDGGHSWNDVLALPTDDQTRLAALIRQPHLPAPAGVVLGAEQLLEAAPAPQPLRRAAAALLADSSGARVALGVHDGRGRPALAISLPDPRQRQGRSTLYLSPTTYLLLQESYTDPLEHFDTYYLSWDFQLPPKNLKVR